MANSKDETLIYFFSFSCCCSFSFWSPSSTIFFKAWIQMCGGWRDTADLDVDVDAGKTVLF